MRGINIKNFVEGLEHSEELEFEYNGKQYIIQPEVNTEGRWFVIYMTDDFFKTSICIAREKKPDKDGVPKEVIDKVLNTKCFEGKSFFEIYNDIQILFWG